MKSMALAGLILPLLFLSPVLAGDSPPNLTGHWVLNEKESDDFREIITAAQGDRDSGPGAPSKGGGRGGGRGGGGGKGGGRGGQDQSDDRTAQAEQKLARAQLEYSRLEIFHDGIELNVTNGMDISRLLYLDGRQMTIWTQHGEAVATATWQDRTLVVVWKTRQDTMSRIRYYSLSEADLRLTVTESRRFPNTDKPLEITMVYDLKPGD